MIKRAVATTFAIIIDLIILYIMHPALNIKSLGMWIFAITALAVIAVVNIINDYIEAYEISSTCSKV